MFKRILVANRGEIALRIFRACRELGIETVAVFSEADRGAAYLSLADEAYCIGLPKAADSYLKIDRVISAAEIGNVQAIHPGYGFLAENAHFADVCRSCNIEFIGPSHEAMALVGDKNSARRVARQAGVPTVPGSDGLIADEAQAMRLAKELGFPVLIKASAGGGGRGMRVAVNELALKAALQQAQAEADAAFGNPEIYLEKYVEHPRHVEVQVLADLHGNAIHLWERDCTMQRRHQKLIEESPAPRLDDGTRAAICEAAVRLVQGGQLHQRRHGRIHRRSQGQLLLHRDERPNPGRAPGHGNGHGHRPDQGADPRGGGRAAAGGAGRHPPARRGHRMPHQRRGPGEGLPPHARPDHRHGHSGWIRRPLRFPHPRRLCGVAVL